MYELKRQSKSKRGQRNPKAERGIHTKDWLYVRKKDKPIILIDQRADPFEQKNLVDNPA